MSKEKNKLENLLDTLDEFMDPSSFALSTDDTHVKDGPDLADQIRSEVEPLLAASRKAVVASDTFLKNLNEEVDEPTISEKVGSLFKKKPKSTSGLGPGGTVTRPPPPVKNPPVRYNHKHIFKYDHRVFLKTVKFSERETGKITKYEDHYAVQESCVIQGCDFVHVNEQTEHRRSGVERGGGLK